MTYRFARLCAGAVLAAAVSAAWAAEPADLLIAPDTTVIRFDIARFAVEGNSLLAQADVDAAVAPFLGAGRDFGDVQQALEALEAAYHQRGYQLVKVQLPEQELNGGVVRLKVLQTRIGRIKVTGNRHFDQANIRRSLPGLVEGQTPNLNDVSAGLRMANDNPAKKVQLKLQGGQDGQDAADSGDGDSVDASLDVTDESPWRVALNADNSGTKQTGKTHVGVMLQHANLWGRDHVAGLQYTTTAEEPGKVAVWGAGYHVPLYAQGDSLDLFASYSNIDTGSVTAGLFDLAVSGKGSVAGARYNLLLARQGERDARVVFGAEIKAFKNSVVYAGENFGNDVTVRPLSVAWVVTTPLGTGAARADASASVTLVRNIAGGSRGGSADFARVRSNAKAAYTLARFAGAYSRAVAEDWQVRLLANGQFTADALVPGEQFGAGGGSTVRGFDERALSTDSGLLANAELYTPQLCAADGRWQCRVLGFVDAAHGSRRHALPGELRSATVSSAGLGVRLAYGTSLNLQADYGHVLHSGAVATPDKHRLHVRVGLAY